MGKDRRTDRSSRKKETRQGEGHNQPSQKKDKKAKRLDEKKGLSEVSKRWLYSDWTKRWLYS